MRKKTYVVDTSVLISDPEVLLKLRGCRIIVPVAAIGELDRLKSGGPGDPRARAARKAARILDTLGSGQDLCRGMDAVGGHCNHLPDLCRSKGASGQLRQQNNRHRP